MSAPKSRLIAIDSARGLAVLAMAVYHVCWDLWYFGLISIDVGHDPAWIVFARAILVSFLLLVGVGLALGHGARPNWPRFWRRWLMVLAGALAISLGTWLTFPQSFVYFGVLHAIALFMLLAVPFLRAPPWLTGAVAGAAIALPLFYTDAFFNAKHWSWLGFWTVPPPTNDLVPVFPWFGVVLLGLVATRLARGRGFKTCSPRPRPKALERPAFNRSRIAALLFCCQNFFCEKLLFVFSPLAPAIRALAALGRWSLVFYLVHQPVVLALVVPLSWLAGSDMAGRERAFLAACQTSCEAAGTLGPQCVTYCQCGRDLITRHDLWEPVFSGVLSADEQRQLEANNRHCSALIYPELRAAPPP